MLRHAGFFLILLPAVGCGQAGVEYAAGAAAASTASAGAKAAGKSIAGALEKLNKNLDDGATASKTEATAPAPASRTKTAARKSTRSAKVEPALVPPEPPPPTFEDPAGIEKGMSYEDVVQRFGPPAIALTTAPGEQMVTYSKKTTTFNLKVVNGKVTAVQKIGG